jgi:hypothetical protein
VALGTKFEAGGGESWVQRDNPVDMDSGLDAPAQNCKPNFAPGRPERRGREGWRQATSVRQSATFFRLELPP